MGVSNQRGFVLATTIWMVAILVLLAGLFHSYVEEQVLQALALQERMQADLDMTSTAASVHHMLATRRKTLAGLTVSPEDQNLPQDESVSRMAQVGNEIRLDGALYRGVGRAYFSIQDQWGLIALNAESTQKVLEEVLPDAVGSQRAKELAAALADYIDENERRRINGAEALHYQTAGLPVPTNWYLRAEAELGNVYGWQALFESESRVNWREMFSITYSNALNINTAPAPLLQARLGLSAEETQTLIEARNTHAFSRLEGVADALGVINVWEEEEFQFFPADEFRVKIWCQDCSSYMVQSLTITENGLDGPWLMDYSYMAPTTGETPGNEVARPVKGSVF